MPPIHVTDITEADIDGAVKAVQYVRCPSPCALRPEEPSLNGALVHEERIVHQDSVELTGAIDRQAFVGDPYNVWVYDHKKVDMQSYDDASWYLMICTMTDM